MEDKPRISEETKKFLEEVEKQKYHVQPREYVPPKSIRERLTEWVHLAPGYVLWLCKALKSVLDIGGFLFMIGGGIAMLAAAWAVWQACSASGWRGLLDWPTLYVVGYFAAMFIINKLRFLMFRIIEGV